MVRESALGGRHGQPCTPGCRRGQDFRHAQAEFGRGESRPIWGAIIGAVASLAAAGVSAYGQNKAAKTAGGKDITHLPQPGYAQGMQHYIAQLLSANATKVAPSFGDYVSSGGTATFPLDRTGFTPKDASQLGLVGKGNQPVPYFDAANQDQLSPEQLMFAIRQGDAGVGKRARRYGKVANHLQEVERHLSAGGLSPETEARLTQKRDRLAGREDYLRRIIFGG